MSKIVKSLSLTTQASLLTFNSLAQTPDPPKQTAKSGTTVHKTAHNAKSKTPTKELSEQVDTLQSKLDTRSFGPRSDIHKQEKHG